jgi:hypothetical protein
MQRSATGMAILTDTATSHTTHPMGLAIHPTAMGLAIHPTAMGLAIPRMVMDIATLHGVCAVGGNLLDVDVDGLDIPFVGPVVMCDRREVLDGVGIIMKP